MRHNHLPILCDSAFTSSNIKLHQMLFLSLYGNDNRLSYRSIYILLLKLFHNSVNTTYISYILVMQQVLQIRSSLPFYFYWIVLFFIYYTIGFFPFSPSPPPLLSPILRDSIRDRLSLLGEYLQHYSLTLFTSSTRSVTAPNYYRRICEHKLFPSNVTFFAIYNKKKKKKKK